VLVKAAGGWVGGCFSDIKPARRSLKPVRYVLGLRGRPESNARLPGETPIAEPNAPRAGKPYPLQCR
jgi:hypothetical protein